MVKLLFTYLSKWKNETLETIPGMVGGREKKKNCRRFEFNYDTL
jgi:hypothetical protein